MRKCRIFKSLPIILLGLAVVLAGVWVAPEALGQESVEQQYVQKWLVRERAATTPASRRQLASDLLEAAQAPGVSPEMTAFMCQRIYLIASREQESFPLAAKALDLMQTVDPSTRLDALQKLRTLYQRAYEAGPSRYLGMGVGLVDATMQVAEQRRRELDDKRIEGAFSLGDVQAELAAIEREYATAQRALSRVMTTARSLADSLRGRNPEAYQQLAAFIEKNSTLESDISRAIESTTAYGAQIAALAEAIDAYESSRTSLRAERVSMLYLVHLDSPAEALPYARQYLDKDRQALLELAAGKNAADLTAAQAIKLAQWYTQLAERAEPAFKANMLIRSYHYLSRCDRAFASNDERLTTARAALAKVHDQLTGYGIDVQGVRLRASDEPEAPKVAVTPRDAEPVRPAVEPEPVEPTVAVQPPVEEPAIEEPMEEPAAVAAADDNPGEGTEIAATPLPTDRSGRPIATCIKCRFEFSPLPGDSTTICNRCASGRKNIFDFGND